MDFFDTLGRQGRVDLLKTLDDMITSPYRGPAVTSMDVFLNRNALSRPVRQSIRDQWTEMNVPQSHAPNDARRPNIHNRNPQPVRNPHNEVRNTHSGVRNPPRHQSNGIPSFKNDFKPSEPTGFSGHFLDERNRQRTSSGAPSSGHFLGKRKKPRIPLPITGTVRDLVPSQFRAVKNKSLVENKRTTTRRVRSTAPPKQLHKYDLEQSIDTNDLTKNSFSDIVGISESPLRRNDDLNFDKKQSPRRTGDNKYYTRISANKVMGHINAEDTGAIPSPHVFEMNLSEINLPKETSLKPISSKTSPITSHVRNIIHKRKHRSKRSAQWSPFPVRKIPVRRNPAKQIGIPYLRPKRQSTYRSNVHRPPPRPFKIRADKPGPLGPFKHQASKPRPIGVPRPPFKQHGSKLKPGPPRRKRQPMLKKMTHGIGEFRKQYMHMNDPRRKKRKSQFMTSTSDHPVIRGINSKGEILTETNFSDLPEFNEHENVGKKQNLESSIHEHNRKMNVENENIYTDLMQQTSRDYKGFGNEDNRKMNVENENIYSDVMQQISLDSEGFENLRTSSLLLHAPKQENDGFDYSERDFSLNNNELIKSALPIRNSHKPTRPPHDEYTVAYEPGPSPAVTITQLPLQTKMPVDHQNVLLYDQNKRPGELVQQHLRRPAVRGRRNSYTKWGRNSGENFRYTKWGRRSKRAAEYDPSQSSHGEIFRNYREIFSESC